MDSHNSGLQIYFVSLTICQPENVDSLTEGRSELIHIIRLALPGYHLVPLVRSELQTHKGPFRSLNY